MKELVCSSGTPEELVDCDCEFDVDPDSEDENTPETTWHYRRTCEHCDYVWWGLHCPHDGYQNPCGNCGVRPTPPENYLPYVELIRRALNTGQHSKAKAEARQALVWLEWYIRQNTRRP